MLGFIAEVSGFILGTWIIISIADTLVVAVVIAGVMVLASKLFGF